MDNTGSYQQPWTTRLKTEIDPELSNSPNSYAFSGNPFSQQLHAATSNISPESESSSLQNWGSNQTMAQPPTTMVGDYMSTPYSATTPWPSMASDQNAYLQKSVDSLINSGLPDFNTMGLPGQKSLDGSLGLNFDTEFGAFEGDGTGSTEHNTIINLGHLSGLDEPINMNTAYQRRQSASSFVSSAGPLADPPDASSYTSDYTPRSTLNKSSTPLSPVLSPRCNSRDLMRSSSQTRNTPSPRPMLRQAPHSYESSKPKRQSMANYASTMAKRPGPYPYASSESQYPPITLPTQATTHALMSNILPSTTFNSAMQYKPIGGLPRFHQPTMPPSNFDPASRVETVPYMMPNGTFRTLQSNVGPGSHHHDHFCDHADPPDLFGALSEEQLVPPLEDMKPEDPELTPHEQEVRFEGDLYTPRFVRGHGNKREGWCGICKPGRWLVLKNSAYWYDKSFTHGISAASGQAFDGPRDTRRTDGNADVWEGLCGSCGEWIALVSSKKKGTTWFRHAYKCHTHSKVKDSPKRRRESTNPRPHTTANTVSMIQPGLGTMIPDASMNPLHSLNGRVETVSPLRPLSSLI